MAERGANIEYCARGETPSSSSVIFVVCWSYLIGECHVCTVTLLNESSHRTLDKLMPAVRKCHAGMDCILRNDRTVHNNDADEAVSMHGYVSVATSYCGRCFTECAVNAKCMCVHFLEVLTTSALRNSAMPAHSKYPALSTANATYGAPWCVKNVNA